MQSVELFSIRKMPPHYKRLLKSFAFAAVRTSYVLVHIRMENTSPPTLVMVEAKSLEKRWGGLTGEIMRRAPLALNHVTGRATGKLASRFAMWRIVVKEIDARGNIMGKSVLKSVYTYAQAKRKLVNVSRAIRKQETDFRKKHSRNPEFTQVAMMVIHHTTDKKAGYPVPVELTGNYFLNHLVYMP